MYASRRRNFLAAGAYIRQKGSCGANRRVSRRLTRRSNPPYFRTLRGSTPYAFGFGKVGLASDVCRTCCRLLSFVRPSSSFVAVAPGPRTYGLAIRCPACEALSVNLVTQLHVDLPFWNDPSVGVVDHVFAKDAFRAVDDFRSELYSASFDERRLHLE